MNQFEEIVHGESRILPPVTFSYANLIRALTRILEAQLDGARYSLFGCDVGLGIERVPLTYRIPDLMVFSLERLSQDRAQTTDDDPYIWTPPDLLVECLSPSNRKGAILELLADYRQIAAPEVWLLSPAERRFTPYRYEAGALREGQSRESGVVTPLLLSGVAVDLTELWAAFQGRMK